MDPYKTLGVSRTATDDEIKKAYRELVKKYHPDKYTDNELKDLAAEKLKAVNAAYDDIQRMRQNKTGHSFNGANASSDPKYSYIRSKIQAGDIGTAEVELDRMTDHDAEWNYLKGLVLLRKGWYDGARQHFAVAHNMDPLNQEYTQAFNSINSMGRGNSGPYGNSSNVGGCSICDICAGFMCADLCCGRGCC